MTSNPIKRLFGGKKAAPRSCEASVIPAKPWYKNQWWRVVDEKPHISAKISNMERNSAGDVFCLRGNLQGARHLYGKLRKNALVGEIIDEVGWSQLFSVSIPNSDNKLVEALITRWWDTTHTFQLPYLEIGFTILDFVAITGISVGIGEALPEFPKRYTKSREEILVEYFPGIYQPTIDGRNISAASVKSYIETWSRNDEAGIFNAATPVQIARVFLFFVMGYVYFPNANDKVLLDWIEVLRDVARLRTYDWGSAILARIYYSLDINCRQVVTSVNCFWQVLEYWAFEYLHTSTPLLNVDTPDIWPCIQRWRKEHRTALVGQMRFKGSSVQEQLELRSPQSIIWQPFHKLLNMDNQFLTLAFNFSTHRVMLLDPEMGGTWYLGDRCYRQVYGTVAIPRNPPIPISHISREQYFQSLRTWPSAQSLVMQCSQEEWQKYWKFVSKGPILPALFRWANHDGVGVPAIVGDDIQIPTAPSASFHPGPYQTHTRASSSSSGPFNLEWEAEVAEISGGISVLRFERPHVFTDTPALHSYTIDQWRQSAIEHREFSKVLQAKLLEQTTLLQQEILRLQQERGTYSNTIYPPQSGQFDEVYRPIMQETLPSFGQYYPTSYMQQIPPYVYSEDNNASSSTHWGVLALDDLLHNDN